MIAEEVVPRTFILKETGEVHGYACPTCGKVYTSAYDNPGDKEKAAVLDVAKRCCADKVCEDCGKISGDSKYIYIYCVECRDKRDDERERERFEKAEKIPFEKYSEDMLYLGDDQWFQDIDELYDFFEDAQIDDPDIEVPKYAWACKPKKFVIEADRIVEGALEEHHEDAYDRISSSAFEELQQFLDGWCAKQDVRTYEYDYTRAVLIPPPMKDEDDST